MNHCLSYVPCKCKYRATNGFNGIKELIPSSINTVFDPSLLTKQVDAAAKLKVSLQMFHEYEQALQQLQLQGQTITVVCKSGARAGAVVAAHQAYVDKKTTAEALEYSQHHGK